MDYNGARPKEKRDTRRGSEGDKEGQNMDYQRSSEEDHLRVSVRMCDVRDKVGASAEFRRLRQDCALSQEIIMSIDSIHDKPFSRFIFGSSSEGTTTPGMNSDRDYLMCFDDQPVVDNIRDADDENSFLIIRDTHTKPGYVKLQLVYYGQPQTIYIRELNRDKEESDSAGRICLKHLSKLGRDYRVDERNGPADTNIKKNFDAVYSYRLSKIPDFCTEWIVRKRQYGWPSKHMLDKMVIMGCFVVGVGYHASKERDIEWRLSFSLQERELMFSMNIVQHKCYILLKLIKKDIIVPAIGKSISSYHLKTCMLYTIENTKAKLWKRSNLVQCVLLCLHVLLEWVLKGYCPNYFIKDENMFDRDMHRTQKKDIEHHLEYLISIGYKFLFQIKLDCIGDLLKHAKKTVQIEYTLLDVNLCIKIDTVMKAVFYKASCCYKVNNSKTPIEALEYVHNIHTYLSQTKCINDHTEQQTQQAFSYIIPYVHLQLAQLYASLAFRTDEFSVKYHLQQLCRYHLNQGRYCDMTSARLLEVTILFKLEQYKQCFQILDQLEKEFNQNPLLICRCDVQRPAGIHDDHGKELYNLNVASILLRTSTCVMFLRSDMVIIPMALQFEMFRSEYESHGPRPKYFDSFMDLAVVDAPIYLQFMKYLVHVNCNQLQHKHSAINKLEYLLSFDQILRHRETGYNLLGWIHFREGLIREAIKYFRKSWSIRPHHNAAKFHVMFYLFG